MTLNPAQRETLDTLLFALRDDELTQCQAVELETLVLGDVEAMQHYLRIANLSVGLRWIAENNDECGMPNDELPSKAGIVLDLQGASVPHSSFLIPHSSFLIPHSSFLIPHSSFLIPHSSFPSSFVGGLTFSYLMAALILGTALTVAWVWKLPDAPQFVRQSVPSPSPLAPGFSSKLQFVGRITGMVDCKWSDPNTAVPGPVAVPLGRKYALSSGLMEITYSSGAKVILQGPCTYEVESKDGGFLSIGKLTARVEVEQAKGFAVRTLTAIVTDLGTEFGVNVSADQTAEVCVFDGVVEVARSVSPSDSKTANAPRRLTANEAIRLIPTGDDKPLLAKSVGAAFVRKLPSHRATSGLARGLVAYWSFDDATNLGKNATGGGDLATIGTASPETTGLLGGALRLHQGSSNDTLLYNGGQGVPKGVPNEDASYSMSAWYRVDAILAKNTLDIVGWGEPVFNRANALILHHDESLKPCKVYNYWWRNDVFGNLDATSATGNWHHVVSTYDSRGKIQYLYLDGVRIGVRGIDPTPVIAANNFAIGCRHGPLKADCQLDYTGGLLDEIGIWNRSLLETEVLELYSNGTGRNPLAQRALPTASAPHERLATQATKDQKEDPSHRWQSHEGGVP